MKDSIRKIFLGKKRNQCPNGQEIVSEDNSVKVYWTEWDSLIIKNDIYFRRFYRKWEIYNLKSYILQVIIPRGKVKQIFQKRSTILFQVDILESTRLSIESESGFIGF